MTWAQDRLIELDDLIDRNKKLIEKYPKLLSLKLALRSKLDHRKELLQKIERKRSNLKGD